MAKQKLIPLATLRAARGLSQKELAKEINVSSGLIGLYETGKRKPSLEKARIIAAYFNTPIESISFSNIE